MATFKRTETLRENHPSTEYSSTWSVEYSTTDIVVSTDSFNLPELTVWAKYSYGTKNYGDFSAYYYVVINGNTQWDGWSHNGLKERDEGWMESGKWYKIADNWNPNIKNIATNKIFDSSNVNKRSVSFQYKLTDIVCSSQRGTDYDRFNYYSWDGDWNIFTTAPTITLDAPPLYDTISIDSSTTYIDAGITRMTTDISNIRAQYEGNITSIKFTIGNQTVTKDTGVLSGNQTLFIDLNAVGTFTPIVTITDSRGQVTTKIFDDITVNSYVAPTVNFTVERTDNVGVINDEGTYVTVPTTLTYDSLGETNHMWIPTVSVVDVEGTQVATTVVWYSTRLNTGVLSGSITNDEDWEEIESGNTIYALLATTNGFDPNTSYTISITPRDKDNSDTIHVGITQSQTLSTGFFTIDVLAGGHGIAFGMPAPLNPIGFFVNMDSYIGLPDYSSQQSTLDKQIYNKIVDLGWDSEVMVDTSNTLPQSNTISE